MAYKKPKKIKSDMSANELLKKAKGSSGPAELIKAGIKSPLILIGEESIRIRRTVTWLKENCLKDISTTSISCTEITSQNHLKPILQSLNNMSLFAETQLFFFSEADSLKAALAKPLAEAIGSKQQTNFIILSGKTINQRTTLFNALTKQGCVVDFPKLQGNDLLRWIDKESKTSGAEGIEPAAAKELAAVYNEDLTTLSNEIQKLALQCDKETPISHQLVKDNLQKGPEKTSFELFEQMAKRNVGACLVLTRSLVSQGLHPLQISSFLSRTLRTALAEKTPSLALPDTEVSNPWFAKKIATAGSRFTENDLVKSIELLAQLDLELKSSGLDDINLLLNTVQRITLRTLNRSLAA